MPKVIKVNEIQSIIGLYANGWSIRRISRELKLNRRTVSKYLKQSQNSSSDKKGSHQEQESTCTSNSNAGTNAKCTSNSNAGTNAKCTSNSNAGSISESPPSFGPKSSCEGFTKIIEDKVIAGLHGQRIYQDLKADHGYNGSVQSVRRFIRKLKKTTDLPHRILHALPGEEVQVDFGQGAWVIQSNGRKKRPWLFRLVLSHSRKGYSEVVYRQDTETFLRCLENAFRYFGGVPQVVITDNLKAAVIKPDWYDPEINPKLRSFAEHYGTVILPAKAYRPELKGKVENGIKYCQDNALKGRQFDSLAQQNIFLRKWEQNVADTRIHGTTQMQVRKAFEEAEKQQLKALPPDLFPCFEEQERKVQRNGHVEVRRSFYSVPPEYLGRKVRVRFDGRTVRVFNHRMEQIAIHCQLEKGKYSTLKEHIPREKINTGEYGSDYLLREIFKIGPECAVWGEVMLANRGIEGIRVLQGLLSLKKKYSSDDLNKAAHKAVFGSVFYLKEFKKLLETPEEQPDLGFLEVHPCIRKLDSYEALTPNVFQAKIFND